MRLSSIFLPLRFTSRLDLVDRLLQLLIGLFLYGLGIAMMMRGPLGVAPWDVLTLGIKKHVNLDVGTIIVLTSIVVLLLWIPLRQRVGLGTIANALLVGVATNVGLLLVPEMPNYVLGVLMFLGGLVVLAIATAIYISADFGPGPRDGLMTGLVARTGGKIWIVRTLIEGSVLVIGWLLGGAVGIGTAIFAFGVGPLVGWMLPVAVRWRTRRSARLATSNTQ